MIKIFENKVAVITGGIGDIGKATAIELAKAGANIALCGLDNEEDAQPVIQEIQQYGVTCTYKRVNVAEAIAVHDWLAEVESTLGVPSIIIGNAATATLAGILEITPQQWANELNVNLNGAFYLTQYATARLVEKDMPGRVVLVGSWAANNVHKHMPAYSVSKAGLNMLCKCLALELAPHDIMVNEIAPGYVAAGLSGRIWKENPGRQEIAIQKVPIKRVITAQEVAEQIVYLCNPSTKHITGATLLMDGGLSLL